MRRLLHFTDQGDTSGYFPQLARHHDRKQYLLYFGTLREMDPDLRAVMESAGVICFDCGARGRIDYPMAFFRLRSFLKAERIDIFHAHLFDPAVVGLPAALAAGTPARVLTRHYSNYHTRIRRPIHVWLDRLCTRLAHRIIAVSRHTAEHLVEVEKAPPAGVRTILNGIDFDRVRLPDPERIAALRAELAPEGAFLILQMARLHEEKGHRFLLEALPEVIRQANRPVRVLFAGAGSSEGELREIVERLKLSASVSFLGFRQDAPELIAAADLFVLPSVAEAFGLVLAEALYLGTPVVASRAGGIPEIVRDGVDGLLVDPADSSQLAVAILKMIGEPALREAFGREGRQWVKDRFSFERMVRQYEDVYSELELPDVPAIQGK